MELFCLIGIFRYLNSPRMKKEFGPNYCQMKESRDTVKAGLLISFKVIPEVAGA